MCFYTTSSDTGHNSSACVILEQKLKKEILSLACGHHIMELIISNVFEVCMRAAYSPEVALLKRFQVYWEMIDPKNYESGVSFDIVAKLVKDVREERIVYAKKHMEQREPKLRGMTKNS